jgi:amino acid transporter
MTFLVLSSGFVIGFTGWKSCFILMRPIADTLFNANELEQKGRAIVNCVVFLFLFCLTSLILLVLPIYGYILGATSEIEFYFNVAVSYLGSIFGFLFLIYLRWFIRRISELGERF